MITEDLGLPVFVTLAHDTFIELYDYKKVYNATLFNEWCLPRLISSNESLTVKYNVHKSLRHYDGELCFEGRYFIVVAVLPTGQISNHYKIEDWNLFKIPVADKVLFEFDGHTSEDTINRLKQL